LGWVVAGMYALLVPLMSLFSAWDPDEALVVSGVEKEHPWMNHPFDLWRFSDGNPEHVRAKILEGQLPWWTSPHWKFALWRPLSSVTLSLDYWLFGWNRFGYQVHSLIWHLLLVLVAGSFLHHAFARTTGVIAFLLFVVSVQHPGPTDWLSARHHLIAATFTVGALLSEHRYRDPDLSAKRWRYIGIVCAIGAALASEAGALGLPTIITYVCIRSDRRRWKDCAAAALPYALILGLYAVAYTTLDRGVSGSCVYQDFRNHPALFLKNLGPQFYAQMVDVLVPVQSGTFTGPWWIPRQALALCIVVLGCYTYRSLEVSERILLVTMGMGTIVMLAGGTAGPSETQFMLFPALWVSILVACEAVVIGRTIGSGASRVLSGCALVVLCTIHLLVPAITSAMEYRKHSDFRRLVGTTYKNLPYGSDQDVYVLRHQTWLLAPVGAYVFPKMGSVAPRQALPLCPPQQCSDDPTPQGCSALRIDSHTLRISYVGPRADMFRRFDLEPLRTNETIAGRGLSIVPRVATAERTVVDAIFESPLDSLNFATTDKQGSRKLSIPAEIGATVDVP
jgi:hypothetical protein